MKLLKISKRDVAKKLREGANNILTYGWTKGTFGSKTYGFCALGSMRDGSWCNGKSYAPYVAAARALSTFLAAAPSEWNDSVLRTKEEVVKGLRAAARAVEHGLVFEQKVWLP